MSKYFQVCRSFLEINDHLFEVIRETSENEVNPEEWKAALGADIVFRREGKLFFSKLVPEAEIATEEHTTEVSQREKIADREILETISSEIRFHHEKFSSQDWYETAAQQILEKLKALAER